MFLEELKKQAEAILAIGDVGNYVPISFTTECGGIPKIGMWCDDSKPDIQQYVQYQGEVKVHLDGNNNQLYAGELVVLCRDTGTKDKNDRNIYLCPNGETFVYVYQSGNVGDTDHGHLCNPDVW
jgi:hypothetical protein